MPRTPQAPSWSRGGLVAVRTDANGVATTQAFVAGSAAGVHLVTATSPALRPVTFRLTTGGVRRVVIQGGERQRSLLTNITVVFAGRVSVHPGTFVLRHLRHGNIPLRVSVRIRGDETVALLTFRTGNLAPHALADGVYA